MWLIHIVVNSFINNMETMNGEGFESVISSDENGIWEFKIKINYPLQLMIKSMDGDSESFINIDFDEAIAIRDVFNRFISGGRCE